MGNLLQLKDTSFYLKIWFIAKNISQQKQDNYEDQFDKTAPPHSFNIDDLVW